MWLIAGKKVYINLIDPKGQIGIKDFSKEQLNEKIMIADKSANLTLPRIEKELNRIHKKEFTINSFILLRDSSELGKRQDTDWKKNNMIKKHILRLDWHECDEEGSLADLEELVEEKSYLDWIFEKTFVT